MLGVISVIISSCQKDKWEISTMCAPSESKVTRQLINFKKSLVLKSNQLISLDSTIWYVEGILNYERANNSHEFTSHKFIKDTIENFSKGENLSTIDILNLYQTLEVILNQRQNQNGNHDIDFIDLNLQRSLNDNNFIIMTHVIGEKGIQPSYKPFGPTDYWEPGGFTGKCGDYAGQCIGRDATTELTSKINSVLSTPGYYTSIVNEYAEPFMFESNDNPYGNFMMWTSTIPNYCISPEELNYYYSKFNFIKDSLQPTGKSFKSVDVIFTVIVGKSTQLHMYDIYYGTKIENPDL